MWNSKEPAISKQRYPIHGRGQREEWERMPLLLLRCFRSRLQWKHQWTLGEKGLARIWVAIINWGIVGMRFRFQRNASTVGPRLAASRSRSSTRVRSSATRALRASISCAVVLSWVACWPNNAPCCTRAARSGSDPAESIVVRLFCQEGEAGFRCGYSGGFIGQQIIRQVKSASTASQRGAESSATQMVRSPRRDEP